MCGTGSPLWLENRIMPFVFEIRDEALLMTDQLDLANPDACFQFNEDSFVCEKSQIFSAFFKNGQE
jgi:hypothetical protein